MNFPEVSLPEHPGKHRLLHIHRNQPGVLSAINAVFSEQQINIAGQYLQTNAKIGYVVIDVETGEPESRSSSNVGWTVPGPSGPASCTEPGSAPYCFRVFLSIHRL